MGRVSHLLQLWWVWPTSGPLGGRVKAAESFPDTLSTSSRYEKWDPLLPFPECPFHPFILPLSHLTFCFGRAGLYHDSFCHKAAASPRAERQPPAAGEAAGVCTCLPDHGVPDQMPDHRVPDQMPDHRVQDQTTCSGYAAPASRLQVKASASKRNAMLCPVPCWMLVLFSTKEGRIRQHSKETVEILPLSYFWRILGFAFPLLYCVQTEVSS